MIRPRRAVEAAHAELEQRVGLGFGQREAVGDAEAGAAHDRETRVGEVAVLGLVDRFRIGRDDADGRDAERFAAVRMACAAVVEGAL